MNTVEDVLTLAAALITALTLLATARAFLRSTLLRRLDYARRLRRLGPGVHVSFFESVLGEPPAIRQSICGHHDWRIWIDRYFFLEVFLDEDDSVSTYTITTRRRSFAPVFVCPGGNGRRRRWVPARLQDHPAFGRVAWKVEPAFRVRLGWTTFASATSWPVPLPEIGLGVRDFSYSESHFFGNPGYYLYYTLSDSAWGAGRGRAARDFLSSGHQGRLIRDADDRSLMDLTQEERTALDAYRRRARINTIMWSVSPGRPPSGRVGVHGDLVRTVA